MILIDSTQYIDWLRRQVDIPRLLDRWIEDEAVVTCGLVRAEVIRGIKNPPQMQNVHELFDSIRDVPIDTALWRTGTELAWPLDRTGQVLPITDLVIGCCAKKVGAAVVTTDQHFQQIPELSVHPKLPVA